MDHPRSLSRGTSLRVRAARRRAVLQLGQVPQVLFRRVPVQVGVQVLPREVVRQRVEEQLHQRSLLVWELLLEHLLVLSVLQCYRGVCAKDRHVGALHDDTLLREMVMI